GTACRSSKHDGRGYCPLPVLVVVLVVPVLGVTGLHALTEILVVLRELRSVGGLLLLAVGRGFRLGRVVGLLVVLVGCFRLRLVGRRYALAERVLLVRVRAPLRRKRFDTLRGAQRLAVLRGVLVIRRNRVRGKRGRRRDCSHQGA